MEDDLDTDFSLKFENKGNYLYVFATGPKDSLIIAKKMWGAIYSKAKELELNSILVEEDFPNQLSTFDMHDIGEFIAEKFMGIKIAHVDRQISDIELNKFVENVAINRGAIGKIFNKIENAVKWLKQ